MCEFGIDRTLLHTCARNGMASRLAPPKRRKQVFKLPKIRPPSYCLPRMWDHNVLPCYFTLPKNLYVAQVPHRTCELLCTQDVQREGHRRLL